MSSGQSVEFQLEDIACDSGGESLSESMNHFHPLLDGKFFKIIKSDKNIIKCKCASCPNKMISIHTISVTNLYTHLKVR